MISLLGSLARYSSRHTPYSVVACLLALSGFGVAFAADPADDPTLRAAARVWDGRRGPRREVLDVVCLVPDVATFFEAIESWDEHVYFPILIDDVETNLKFARAFRPSRIVRYPRSEAKVEGARSWERTVQAVVRAWRSGEGDGPAGNVRPPADLGPTPPGVVVSHAEAPMLAGAAALAAGRFQPLIRIDSERHFLDVLSESEAGAFDERLRAATSQVFQNFERLGDDCDFVTVAGDFPYRYRSALGDEALDDRLARDSKASARWGYCGRLTGDAKLSVYRAMCSLFLQPDSALLFNAYPTSEPQWREFDQGNAAHLLNTMIPVLSRVGARADRAGWHKSFRLGNSHGLLLINTHGGPTEFFLANGPGLAGDIPPSVPSVAYLVHSFSASNPNEAETLAARWLAQGAFIFYGSMNEPYLTAFRTPTTVARLMAERIPLAAAFRQGAGEPFARPWRLVYFGDPLYTLEPDAARRPRGSRAADPTIEWPRYADPGLVPEDAHALTKFGILLKRRLLATRTRTGAGNFNWRAALRSIDRDAIPSAWRPSFDVLASDILLGEGRFAEERERLEAIPPQERSEQSSRSLEWCWTVEFERESNRGDFDSAAKKWLSAARSSPSRRFFEPFTTRLGSTAEKSHRLGVWLETLKRAEGSSLDPSTATVVANERVRVAKMVGSPGVERKRVP